MSFGMKLVKMTSRDGKTFYEVQNEVAIDNAPDWIEINGHSHDGNPHSASDSLTVRDARGYWLSMGAPYPVMTTENASA
jgi:hypothetical protein